MNLDLKNKPIVSFVYLNSKGKKESRRIVVLNLFYGTHSIYFKTPKHLIFGFDLDKEETRFFSFENVSEFKESGKYIA